MARVLRPAALHVAIAVVLLQLLAATSSSFAPDTVSRGYQDDEAQVRGVLQQADSLTILNVGDSHGLAIDFASLERKGYHLWRVGGDLFEAKHLVEELAPRMPKLSTVLIALSWPTIAADNGALPERSVRRRQLYASSPSWSPLPDDRKDFLRGKAHAIFPVDFVARPDNWKGLILRTAGKAPVQPIRRSIDGHQATAAYTSCRTLDSDAMRKHAADAVERHQAGMTRVRRTEAHVRPRVEQALAELVLGLRERHVRVVLYTAPLSRPYQAKFSEQEAQRSAAAYKRIASELGIPYLNFANDGRFSDMELFQDSDHLNRCGARRFSRLLFEQHSEEMFAGQHHR